MATSGRAPARATKKRVSARNGTRAVAGKKAAARKEEGPEVVILDGRRLSRRIEFTGRLTEHIRQRYVEAGEGADVIARSVGVAKATLQRLIREQGWTRAEAGPRDLSRAEQLAAEARALAKGEDAAPVDVGDQIERLLRLVSAEIGVYENLRATLQREPQGQREAQKTAHHLASLTSTLETLRRMRAGQTATVSDDTDDLPADIDALRESLARRIEAFMANQPDDGLAGEPEPGRVDRA